MRLTEGHRDDAEHLRWCAECTRQQEAARRPRWWYYLFAGIASLLLWWLLIRGVRGVVQLIGALVGAW